VIHPTRSHEATKYWPVVERGDEVMVKKKRKQDSKKSIFDKSSLTEFVKNHGWKSTHVKHLYKILRRTAKSTSIAEFERVFKLALTNEHTFPNNMIECVLKSFQVFTTRVVKTYISKDGTVKMIVKTHDDHKVRVFKKKEKNTHTHPHVLAPTYPHT
jgi:uncharacterized protein (DUF488 family)